MCPSFVGGNLKRTMPKKLHDYSGLDVSILRLSYQNKKKLNCIQKTVLLKSLLQLDFIFHCILIYVNQRMENMQNDTHIHGFSLLYWGIFSFSSISWDKVSKSNSAFPSFIMRTIYYYRFTSHRQVYIPCRENKNIFFQK